MPSATVEGIQLFERLDTLWRQQVAEHGGLRKYRDLQQASKEEMLAYLAYNCDLELQAANRAGDSAKRFLEPDIKRFHERQHAEEILHYRLTKRELERHRVDPSGYETHPAIREMNEAYQAYETPVERICFFNLGSEKTALFGLTANAKVALALREFETAQVYCYHLLPDEMFHTDYGPLYILSRYAGSEETQARAEAALRNGLQMKARALQAILPTWKEQRAPGST